MLLLLLGALVVLGIPYRTADSDRLLGCLQDAAHFPFFFLLFAALARLWRAGRPTTVLAILALVILFLLGAEAIQPLVGRSASIRDVLFGLAGTLSAACLVAGRSAGPRTRHGLQFLALSLAAAAILPPAAIVLDRFRAGDDLPVLGSFERPMEKGRWTFNGCRVDRVTGHATAGRYALRVEVTNDVPYPGLFLTDAPRDWRGYGQVCADVFLDGASGRALWVRIDDRNGASYAERFQAARELMPGTNTLCVGLGGLQTESGHPMDLSHMISVGFFFDRAGVGDRIWLDQVRLAP